MSGRGDSPDRDLSIGGLKSVTAQKKWDPPHHPHPHPHPHPQQLESAEPRPSRVVQSESVHITLHLFFFFLQEKSDAKIIRDRSHKVV